MKKKKPDNSTIMEVAAAKLGNREQTAEALGVARMTLYRWIEGDTELKKEFEYQEQANIDFVESKLFERIKGGTYGKATLPPDPTSIIFYLKTKGKHRGYIETKRFEHDFKDPAEQRQELFKRLDTLANGSTNGRDPEDSRG